MIATLTGTVQAVYPDYVVFLVGYVGYKVVTPNPYELPRDELMTLYTYLNVREDALELFGFKDPITKEFFEKLIKVNGIGPKTACAILAGGEVSEVVSAIERGDGKYLTKFPKIGPKTAQQIILDLKGKIKITETVAQNTELDEALEALEALGYTSKEIERVTKLLRTEEAKSTQEYLTLALKYMLK